MISWINEALKLSPGESIFLPSETRDSAKTLVKNFKKELRVLAEVNPMRANQLLPSVAIKEGLYWIELKRIFGSPLVGFKKTANGNTVRVMLDDPEKKRRLFLMWQDGLSLEEVEGIEGELSEEERNLWQRNDQSEQE